MIIINWSTRYHTSLSLSLTVSRNHGRESEFIASGAENTRTDRAGLAEKKFTKLRLYVSADKKKKKKIRRNTT